MGAAWARHHAAFADFVKEYGNGAVVDVGGGSGTLAVAYRKAGGRMRWTILEPHALRTPQLPADIEVIDGFLDKATLTSLRTSTVVLCHVFEHFVDLRAAVKDLSESLPQDGRIIIAWPELEDWILKGQAGALNFEHGIYASVASLRALFNEFGWKLLGQSRWDENDTCFLALGRGTDQSVFASPDRTSGEAISRYFARFAVQAAQLSSLLRADCDAYLMPASIYAQALLAAGLPQGRFACLVDNSPVKQGRRLFGTRLFVKAPEEVLSGARNPMVVLNGGAHETEMAHGLRRIRADVRVVRQDGSEVTA